MRKVVKSAIAVAAATVMAFGMIAGTGITVMANDNVPALGCCGGLGRNIGGGMMWDEDGNFLTREAFEARLDAWIADGLIRSQDRAFMLERFDWCAANGGGATGVRGACGGFGNGGGRGRGGNVSRWS